MNCAQTENSALIAYGPQVQAESSAGEAEGWSAVGDFCETMPRQSWPVIS